jgi:hypothetical protein
MNEPRESALDIFYVVYQLFFPWRPDRASVLKDWSDLGLLTVNRLTG